MKYRNALLALLIISIFVLMMAFRPRAEAATTTYYVATNGDDSWSGAHAAPNAAGTDGPFATIQKAQSIVRAAISAGMKGNIIVYLRAGTYTLMSPLSFTFADSGSNGYTITWSSYRGESAVISGGASIIGWTLYNSSNNIYRAPVGIGWNFRELYVNGNHATRASSALNPSGWALTSTGFAAPDSTMASWGNISNIEFVMNGHWMMTRCKVSSISGTAVTMQQPCFANFKAFAATWGAGAPTWIENAYELLSPGEWYLDTSAGYVYYQPASGQTMNSATVVAPKLQSLISANRLSNVIFSSLSFEYTTWLGPDQSGNGYVDSQSGYNWTGSNRSGQHPMWSPITFESSSHITFEHDLFSHLGGRALLFNSGNQNINILANRFIDNSAGAIQFGNVNNPNTTNTALQSLNATIRDNYFTDGFEYTDTSTVFAPYAADVVIDHNRFAGAPWSPITIGWGWGTDSYSKDNQVTWNHISNFCHSYKDCGAIYTLSAQPGFVASNNYMTGGGEGYGCIYPDEGSAEETWTSNVCNDVSVTWLHIWKASITGNSIADNWTSNGDMLDKGNNNTVSRNIVVSNGQWPSGAKTVISGAGITAGVTPGPSGSSSFVPPPAPTTSPRTDYRAIRTNPLR
jgi:hypothetical protein